MSDDSFEPYKTSDELKDLEKEVEKRESWRKKIRSGIEKWKKETEEVARKKKEGKREFTCPVCKQGLQTERGLHIHQRRKQHVTSKQTDQEAEESSKESSEEESEEFSCPVCKMGFSRAR